MAPKTASMALLFHPKKSTKQQVQTQAPSPKAGPSTPNSNSSQSQGASSQPTNGQTPRRRPPPKKVETEEEELKLPEGPYQEYKLLSSALNGWRYDVMKFESRRPVDIFQWKQPIKLNRKDIRKDGPATNTAPEAVGPMLGPDGKPVIGADGKMVMVDADGRPIQASSTNGSANNKDKDKGGKGAANAKKRFQRKTRQVFFVPDEVRQLRREERYPWVMEDSNPTNGEYWTGQMEDASKSETHAFFMPAANESFKFVPAHRWYKFQRRIEHNLPKDLAGVDSMVLNITSCVQYLDQLMLRFSILLRAVQRCQT